MMPEVEEEVKGPKIIPKTEVEKRAEEIKAERALPLKPGNKVEFKQMVEWSKLLEPTQRKRVMIYLYRTEPIINRQLVDPTVDNNIDVFYDVNPDILTEEYILDRHGSGSYNFLVKDLDNPRTQKGGFFEATLYIANHKGPPKLDLREVEWDNPRNKGFKAWAKAAKLIDDNGMPIVEQKREAPGGQDSASMVKMMELALGYAEKMGDRGNKKSSEEASSNKIVGDLMLEKMKQDDPNKRQESTLAVIQALKDRPEPKDNTATIVSLITAMIESGRQQGQQMMQMILESNKSQMALMMKMMEMGQTANSGEAKETSRLQELKDLLEVAREIKGGGGVERERPLSEQLMEFGAAIMPEGLRLVNNVMQANMMRPGGVPNAAPNGPTAQVPVGGKVVSMPINNSGPVPDSQQMQPAQQIGAPQPMQPPTLQQLIMQFYPLMKGWLTKPGYEFAEWAELLPDGAPMVAMLTKDGEEKFFAMLKTLPVWGEVEGTYGEAHMRKWVHEFVNFRKFLDGGEDE